MRISIIIPAHNETNYLALCLNAYTKQTEPPDELLIIDDNSTDNTYAVALEFANKYSWIRLIKHESNSQHLPGKKVIAAFNFGLQHVSEYDLSLIHI